MISPTFPSCPTCGAMPWERCRSPRTGRPVNRHVDAPPRTCTCGGTPYAPLALRCIDCYIEHRRWLNREAGELRRRRDGTPIRDDHALPAGCWIPKPGNPLVRIYQPTTTEGALTA